MKWLERYRAYKKELKDARVREAWGGLEFGTLPALEQARILEDIGASIDKHPDLVTIADIARWEVLDEPF